MARSSPRQDEHRIMISAKRVKLESNFIHVYATFARWLGPASQFAEKLDFEARAPLGR
jgi:hypothetical protein